MGEEVQLGIGDASHKTVGGTLQLPPTSRAFAFAARRRGCVRSMLLMRHRRRWLYRRDRRRCRGIERCHRAVMQNSQSHRLTVFARRRRLAAVCAGKEAPRSCRYSLKLNACGASVLAEPDDSSRSSFPCCSGGASMLIAANSSSAVGLARNVAESSSKLRSASSNAGRAAYNWAGQLLSPRWMLPDGCAVRPGFARPWSWNTSVPYSSARS